MNSKNSTKWHQILAAVQQEHLKPVGISVTPEVVVNSLPPRGDILLSRDKDLSGWTKEQRARLPSGIRDSQASRIFIEFKYTESVNQETFEQILGYLYNYRQKEKLSREELQGFVVSAKTPRRSTLEAFGYKPTEQAGVYQSDNIFLLDIPLLVLNQLSDESHNTFFKLFASTKRERSKAMARVQEWKPTLSTRLGWILDGLFKIWQGVKLMEAITVDLLMEQGRALEQVVLSMLTKKKLFNLPEGEQLWEEGHEKGREEGREKGREEGERKAWQTMFDTLRRVLVLQFEVKLTHFDKRLERLNLSELKELSDAAFNEKTLAEFEAVLIKIEAKKSKDKAVVQ